MNLVIYLSESLSITGGRKLVSYATRHSCPNFMLSVGCFQRSLARELHGCSWSRPVGTSSGTSRRLYAAQPAGGDVPVGRLRQMHTVPEQPGRWIPAPDGPRIAAENLLVVVEPPRPSTAECKNVFEPCNNHHLFFNLCNGTRARVASSFGTCRTVTSTTE
jgi:hypothetical protein